VIGLGPSGLEFLDQVQSKKLLDESHTVIVRTARHPAAQQLSAKRVIESCDDLYESHTDFDSLYVAIADRVIEAAASGDVVYAVPGSASVGERSVSLLRTRCLETGTDITVLPGLSFLDLVYIAANIDPIADGLQILDARVLPDPLPLHLPTVITQVDSQLRASDVSLALGRTLNPDHAVLVLDRLGDRDEVCEEHTLESFATYPAGARTTVFVSPVHSGIFGLIATNRILREQCPWDMKQTHHTLLTHLIEEAYEAADAISALPIEAPGGEPDFGAYAEVEEELGDLLLQVVFHATLASETGAFDIDEVAEGIRRKLVARHPHVFGDTIVSGATEVLANWEKLKQEEKKRASLMDDIPSGMPAVVRATKVQGRARSVGFDWSEPEQVVRVLRSEIEELVAAKGDDAVLHELGDVLFSAVNLARHLRVDPEIALRLSVERFIARFRSMEQQFIEEGGSVVEASSGQMETAWALAKRQTT
ncbi:MAG: nucleoside triphosphate pyrophosphohydrolase, partial [Actinomycetota bacterium]|nr:nucleoside triphosphate pyrophosphohydrolase [Actinomycetota bacterium]